MGLTNSSTGGSVLKSRNQRVVFDKTVVLAGCPNVGKSTVFNALTGMNQHTGNWAGKTVSIAEGIYKGRGGTYRIIDLPGTYSLFSGSSEQELARDHICFGNYDLLVAVCDATALERNLILVLQMIEASDNVILCINLMDEAEKKGIEIDFDTLEKLLGIPVIPVSANNKSTLKALEEMIEKGKDGDHKVKTTNYPRAVTESCEILMSGSSKLVQMSRRGLFASLRLLGGESSFEKAFADHFGNQIIQKKEYKEALASAKDHLYKNGICSCIEFHDAVLESLVKNAENIASRAVRFKKSQVYERDRRLDRILTDRKYGFAAMLILLSAVFFITIWGANYISDFLYYIFGKLQLLLERFVGGLGIGKKGIGFIIDGVFGTTATVVSVMLPPMAIFFPLFTILEDLGYLPRIAYNLDRPFKKCGSCGKMSLTMCMGLGCNAAGVVGSRIIDSRKERIIAIVTNSFMPCNGKFSGLITVITLFVITGGGLLSKLGSAACVLGLIALGAVISLASSHILSRTLLSGESSHFVLELPSYRKPQFLRVIVRSMLDRTLFVLARAIAVAAPAGALIWLLANINVSGVSLLGHMSSFFSDIGEFMGLDGMILTAFLLGFPANEIVIPLIIMGYSAETSINFEMGYEGIGALLTANNWSVKTAICFLIFSLFHFPCSTTLLTVKKETGSVFWTLVSALLPTFIGFVLCSIINFAFSLGV